MPTRVIIMLLACAVWLGARALDPPPMTRAEACRIIDSSASDPLCGLWRMGDDGATVAIIPAAVRVGSFDIYLIDSPDMSVIPGRRIGGASPTGAPATYDARIEGAGRLIAKSQTFIFTLTDENRIAVKPYKKGKKISLRRWLPYLYRFTISDVDTRPANADGAVRVYPDLSPSSPVVL